MKKNNYIIHKNQTKCKRKNYQDGLTDNPF